MDRAQSRHTLRGPVRMAWFPPARVTQPPSRSRSERSEAVSNNVIAGCLIRRSNGATPPASSWNHSASAAVNASAPKATYAMRLRGWTRRGRGWWSKRLFVGPKRRSSSHAVGCEPPRACTRVSRLRAGNSTSSSSVGAAWRIRASFGAKRRSLTGRRQAQRPRLRFHQWPATPRGWSARRRPGGRRSEM